MGRADREREVTETLHLVIKKAVKSMGRLRLALAGPAGSGKTWTALAIATVIAKLAGKKILLIDTERGSAAKYAGDSFWGGVFDFDVLELSESHHPGAYIEALKMAEQSGEYAVVIIDSLSHAWMGKDGALALVDQAAKKSQSQNSYFAWRDVTPLHNALVDAMLNIETHLIVTLRSKTEYVLEVTEKGTQKPKKVGMAPIQRDGLEYEFDVVGDLTIDNGISFAKTRCRALKGKFYEPDGQNGTDYKTLAGVLSTWLTEGKPADAANPVLEERTIGEAVKPVVVTPSLSAAEMAAPALLKKLEEPPTFGEAVEAVRALISPEAYAASLSFFDVKNVEDITEKGAQLQFYKMLQAAQKKEKPKATGTAKGSRLAAQIK
jgi:DNA polymerase III delta prime subunit